MHRTQALLFVFSALVLAGCDGKTNPVSPTPTPTPDSASPVSLAIGGTTSLVHPGDTAQLIATVTFSDNTSRDVTADASWRGSGALAIVGPGLITATRYGDGSFSASYLSVSGGSLVRVLPAGAFLIDGLVSAQGTFLPGLARARVELSSRSGTYRTTSSESGWFFLPAAGETTIRVERDGFRPQVKQMTVEHDESVDFELQPVDTPDDDVSGIYRLTVRASPSCVLPPEIMQRSYDARIQQIQQDLFVLLGGANLVAWAGRTGFTGRRNGNAVRFVVRDTFDDGYNFIELIDSAPRRDLYYSGTAVGNADQTRIVSVFSGKLELRSGLTTLAKCEAPDHRFEMTRSGQTTSRIERRLSH